MPHDSGCYKFVALLAFSHTNAAPIAALTNKVDEDDLTIDDARIPLRSVCSATRLMRRLMQQKELTSCGRRSREDLCRNILRLARNRLIARITPGTIVREMLVNSTSLIMVASLLT